MLAHLLAELKNQKTDDLFTYSIVVVDNVKNNLGKKNLSFKMYRCFQD